MARTILFASKTTRDDSVLGFRGWSVWRPLRFCLRVVAVKAAGVVLEALKTVRAANGRNCCEDAGMSVSAAECRPRYFPTSMNREGLRTDEQF